MRPTVLIVDDQLGARKALAGEFEDAGFAVVAARDGDEAWERFRSAPPDIVVTDMVMPRCDGIALTTRIRERSQVPVIMFTAYGTVESAVTALKSGADEFVSSEAVDSDELIDLARRSLGMPVPAGVASDPIADRPAGDVPGTGSPRRRAAGGRSDPIAQRLVGDSPAIARARRQIAGLAPLKTPVLVSGENGSGRSRVVQILHEFGSTHGGRLRTVRPDGPHFEERPLPDCEAIHLDGIDRFPRPAQSLWGRRLSASQLARFRTGPRFFASAGPLGPGGRSRWDAALASGLARFEIRLPPLRERREDIPMIVSALARRIGGTLGRPAPSISDCAVELLGRHPWPGNVAQLRTLLEKAVAFDVEGQVTAAGLEPILQSEEDTLSAIRRRRNVQEREALLDAVRRSGGNITRVARDLRRSRAAVYRLLVKHGLKPGE